ncbi:MAG: hypothetical protein AAF762_03765 [Pseudomonadota bacterium]
MGRLIAFFLAVFALPAFADSGVGVDRPDTPVLIVDRQDNAIAMFVTMPATQLSTVFATGAESMLDAEGTIDIDRLYDGTYLLADEIFSKVDSSLAGEDVVFEAMSMMVHDPAILPPFRDPWDGQTSIAVCTSPETVDNLPLGPLQAYLGYFAYDVSGNAELSLTLPETGRDAVDIEVRQFWNGEPYDTQVVSLSDGGTLQLTEVSGVPAATSTGGLAAVLTVLALSAGGLGYLRMRGAPIPSNT